MYKRLVVKIGTNVISRNDRLAEDVVQDIVNQVVGLRAQGIEVLLITSGAIATGKGLVALHGASATAERQVFAAVGQIGLMSLYSKFFDAKGHRCGQVLVTKGDFRDKQHYANMKSCFENLLRENIIPVVNENDAISISKLVFTDNDELAGLIASQLDVDAVIFLSSVNGVLKEEVTIPEIREEDIASFERYVTDTKSTGGRGGMLTKFAIARRLMAHGITVHVVSGKRGHVLIDIVEGKPLGTKFVPTKKISAVKRRLAYSEGLSVGVVYVDAGAEKVLRSGKSNSLLPVGVRKIEGEFKKGDTIEIRNEAGKKLGYGVAQYGADEAGILVGKKGARALIHYNYMVISD
ncbi:glutamate 5-kinase [Candidatus Kaiserbacteria bacterium RIFCSPLOWO2_12_FULL_53_8]|uniref:Glutamate 5-kinase n=2 Tax=Candidatus Kaiseribacteriota TaxID=1752734 RepID=A0A1F6CTB4_9BACT|nr:MAG: glutamate 5-kinase [Candidatus Kaiserbacteria bacterium RIFCSPHIGHO2_01_FULL_53_29]OGG91039.1 MAG: glutamate 5-kinase [Candidatus Kaiserbacteria bacterium RIFCSPLOWO2_12_FULL_53_8]